MIKFIIVAEVKMDDAKVAELQKWNVEPSDHVITLMSENARDLGLIVKIRATETDYNMFDEVNHSVEIIQKDKAFAELENEITNRACIGGSCED